ncbi:MAG: hypothetical protein Q9214_000577 [Letrouitia sp. 1 TL-2023]
MAPPIPYLPTQELLNQTSASRFTRNACSLATIPPHAFTSFVTDYQQSPWPTQPQSPRHPTPITTPAFGQTQEDFVLFPSNTSAAPARRNTELAPATSRTVPNQSPLESPLSGYQQQQRRRDFGQQVPPSVPSPVSSLQNTGGTDQIQGSGHNSLPPSQRLSPTGYNPRQQLYLSPAPSSSTSLPQPQVRPPVPLFSENSTESMQRSPAMAPFDATEGTSPQIHNRGVLPPLTTLATDFPIHSFSDVGDVALQNSHPSFFSYDFYSLNEIPVNALASLGGVKGHDITTVSPREVEKEVSAPASSTYTNLETPATTTLETPATTLDESPSMLFSNETSPLMELENDGQNWGSLFPDDEHSGSTGYSGSFDTDSPMAPRTNSLTMARQVSSPGRSSSHDSPKPRQSSGHGIIKKSRRGGNLKSLVPDPKDVAAVKRCRNTLAARESRARKAARLETLIQENEQLVVDLEEWKRRAISLGWSSE